MHCIVLLCGNYIACNLMILLQDENLWIIQYPCRAGDSMNP